MPSTWATYTAAPHRVLFLPGAIQLVLAMLWWLLDLESRLGGLVGMPMPRIPSSLAHGWLMLYGLFPFFIFGFLFTAGPNWLSAPPITRRHHIATGLLMAAGSLLFYPGLFLPGLLTLGLTLHLAGWGIGLWALWKSLRAANVADRLHAWLAWAATLLGALGSLSYLLGAGAGVTVGFGVADLLGTWGFLVPLFLVVCHRMIPWFTSRVVANYVLIRPYSLLWFMLAASLTHGLLAGLGYLQWTWLADLPLAASAIWFTSRWGIARGLQVRLLAMLHIAFLWAGLAFGLFALDSLALYLGLGWNLGMAPLHALGIGFFASMLLGMASRVSLGHSGRKLEADNPTWALFWVLQAAALLRMLPDLLPAVIAYRAASLAALLWLLAFALWAMKYAPLYWRPRVDGKPG